MADKSKWDAEWAKIVRGVYAMIVGTIVIIAALQIVPHMLEDGDLTMTEGIFAGSLVAGGFVAAMPWIFMPVLSLVLNFFRKEKESDGE